MIELAVPKLIHKIGFGYKVDYMPAPLVIGYHQLSKKIAQAGFKIKVALVPLSDVTPEWDLLFVPNVLVPEARLILSLEKVIGLAEFANQPEYTDLIRRLQEGTEICAQRIDPNSKADTIVSYRGYDRID